MGVGGLPPRDFGPFGDVRFRGLGFGLGFGFGSQGLIPSKGL